LVVHPRALVLGVAVTGARLEEQAMRVAAEHLVAIAGSGRPLVFVGAEVVAFAAQGAVEVAALIQAPAAGEVAAEPACALHPVGARILAPGAGGELALRAAEGQVHLADQALAVGVAARQGHAELALAAPALVDLRVARWREAGIGLELGVGGRWCEQGGQEEGGEAWGHALGLWERGGGPAIVASRSRGAYLSIGTMRAMQGNNPVTGELSNS